MPNQNEYLAKKSLLDTKQDTLTAGDNININNNNVISVQGLPKDVKVDGSSVVDINGNANIDLTGKQDTLTAGNNITIQNNEISANIEANPQDTPTEDLNSIEIDGTVYNIAGSGGSSVIPNPQGTPTDTLNTIEIDGTIFDIEGSGSGSGLIDDTIYSSSVDNSVMPLSKSIANYDYIWVMAGYTQDGQNIKLASVFNASDLKDAIGTTERFGISNDAYYIYFSVDSLTQFSKYTWQDRVFIQEVHGLKFSGGSGGGGDSAYTETLLYDSGSPITGAPFNQDVALLDNLSKYDTILIEWNTSQDRTNASPNEETDIVFCTVEELLRNNFILHFTGYGTRWGDIKFTDTSFKFTNRGGDKNPEIYKIKGLKFEGGSGESSGGILDEVIFTDTTGTTGTRNITLTKSLNNFDAIYFEWFGTTEEQYVASHVSSVYPIEVNDNGNVSVVCYPTYGNRYIVLTGDPTSTSVSLQSGTWETVPLSVYKIHGVKFSGGGGGSSHKDFKNLITPPITTTGTVTLNDSIEDYDFIEVELTYLNGEGNPVCGSTMASVEYLKNNYNNTTSIWVDGGNNDRSVKVAFTDGTTMIVKKASISDAITGVYGINIQSGGGSSGKAITETTLWTGSIPSPDTSGVLSEPLSNYDYLLTYINIPTRDGEYHIDCLNARMLKESLDNGIQPFFSYEYYDTMYRRCKFTDETHFTYVEGDGNDCFYSKITGIKIGAGGSGGTSVEANPQEEPTDTLTKIKIEDTVYEIQGGGSSEGSGLQRTVLWDYIDDNSGTIPYDIYSVTLRDDINNYDAITLELVSWSGDLDGSWRGTNISNTFFVDVLNNQLEPGNAIVCTFSQRSVKFYIHDNIVSTTVRNESSTNGLVRVYGLTFGGGKAASEIIPITAGDGTTSRTFTFDKIPKKVSMQYIAGGWGFYRDIIWGADRSYYQASQATVSDSQTYVGVSGIICDETTKSITITGLNALQASNTADIVGYMYVDYGGGGSGSSSEPDISDMTWTAITSTSYGQSPAVAIPQGTKRLVLTAEYDGIVTKVAEEKIENIQKLLDTSLQSTWNMGAEYADTSGNHTFVAMSVNNNLATAYSGYSGVVVKIYALS